MKGNILICHLSKSDKKIDISFIYPYPAQRQAQCISRLSIEKAERACVRACVQTWQSNYNYMPSVLVSSSYANSKLEEIN